METRPHVIFGTGPVGCWTARSLVDRGLPVRAVNRSGARAGLLPQEVELVSGRRRRSRPGGRRRGGRFRGLPGAQPAVPPVGRAVPGAPGRRARRRRGGGRPVRLDREPLPLRLVGGHDRGVTRSLRCRRRASCGGGWRTRSPPPTRDGTVPRCAVALLRLLRPGRDGLRARRARVPAARRRQEGAGGRFRYAAALVRLHRGRRPGGGRAGRPRRGARARLVRTARAGADAGRHGRSCVPGARPEPAVAVVSPVMMRLAGLFVPGRRASVEMMYEFTSRSSSTRVVSRTRSVYCRRRWTRVSGGRSRGTGRAGSLRDRPLLDCALRSAPPT